MKKWIHASTTASSISHLPEYCKTWPDSDIAVVKPEIESLVSSIQEYFAKYNWTQEMLDKNIQTHVDKSLPWAVVRKFIRDVVDEPVFKEDADLAEALVKEFGPTKGEDIFREVKSTGRTVDSVIQKYK